MTNRIATLRRAALHLRIATFQSLPWEVRAAHVLRELFGAVKKRRIDDDEDYGPTMIAAIIEKGLASAAKKHGVFFDFTNMGATIYKKLIGKATRMLGGRGQNALSDAATDAILDYDAKGFGKLDFTMSPSKVQSYVAGKIDGKLDDIIKKERVEDSKNVNTLKKQNDLFDSKIESLDIEDKSALKPFAELFQHGATAELDRKLNAVIPWAGAWWKLIKEGYTDAEIIGIKEQGRPSLLAEKLGLPTEWLPIPGSDVLMSRASWSKRGGWKDKLLAVFRDHLMEAKEDFLSEEAEDMGLEFSDLADLL